MIVVSDTTSIISLLKAGCLELLRAMFGEVVIPDAVYNELVLNPRFTDEAKLVTSTVFIRKVVLHNTQEVQRLMKSAGLNKGESEAIALSHEIEAPRVFDGRGERQVAKRMRLAVMGTLGPLLASCKRGLLRREDVLECIDLMKMAGIRISDTLHWYIIDKLKVK